jgi:curli biogenesis system outer membrane secretion channel CsgG
MGIVVLSTACASTPEKGSVASEGSTVKTVEQDVMKCSSTVASVMVGKFECKSPQCSEQSVQPNNVMALALLAGGAVPAGLGDLGGGMSSMITTALKESGCFDVQDRKEMKQIEEELARVGKKVKVQQADYIISGTITDAALTRQKRKIGGGWIPVIGSIKKETMKAKMDFDLKIIDVNKANIAAAKTFSADSESTSTSVNWFGYRDIAAFGSLASIKDTPMEGVIRDIMNAAVDYTAGVLMKDRNTSEMLHSTAVE